MNILASTQIAGLAGMIGPVWLCGTIATLSVVQYEFMRSIGWHPLDAPTFDWPSGLALGPHGWAMAAAFLGCGALLPIFASGLQRALPPGSRSGPALIAASGLAMALLAAPTDSTLVGIRTPLGYLHDAAFVALGLTLFPGLALTAWRMSVHPRWRLLAVLIGLVALVGAAAFIFKGPLFYLMLLIVPGWFALAGWQLMQTTPDHKVPETPAPDRPGGSVR